jgi:thermostable 8-oxoguanine DNA glycosylase
MQQGTVFIGSTVVTIEFPDPNESIMPGVTWGSLDAFPTPAYWAYQVMARRIERKQITYRLGRTLKEEVAACLLGGHGIPASMGNAAFNHLKAHRCFDDVAPTEVELYEMLSAKIDVGGKFAHYRFARQKAKYLAAAFEHLALAEIPSHSGKALRNWLMAAPGIGYKTASWIARNYMDADDVAILDIHILRAGLLAGFFEPAMTVERHYLELESKFIEFSLSLGTRPSELDAVIWHEMMSSSSTIHRILGMGKAPQSGVSHKLSKKRNADASQLPLLV